MVSNIAQKSAKTRKDIATVPPQVGIKYILHTANQPKVNTVLTNVNEIVMKRAAPKGCGDV